MIRNYNNNSLSAPPHPSRYKSSESDVSSCTGLGCPRPTPHAAERRPSSSPGGPRSQRSPHRADPPPPQSSYSHLRPHQGTATAATTYLTPPAPTQDGSPRRRHNGYRSASPTSVSSSPGAMTLGNGGGGGGEGWGAGGGELVPVVLGRSEGDQGLGFSMTSGGWDAQMAVVKRVWDARRCGSLQPGDAIVKINGANVQSLSLAQVTKGLECGVVRQEETGC